MSRKAPPNYGAMEATTEVQFSGGDPTVEFNSLCDGIVTNIYTINSSYRTLDMSLKSLGTSKDGPGLRNKIHVTQLSSNQIVSETTRSLQLLNNIVRRGSKQQRLQAGRLTDNFKEAVEKYSTLQKLVAEKMKYYLKPFHEDDDIAQEEDPEVQKQAQVAREVQFENDMLLDREVEIRKIEADILDVNEIMRELSVLVHNQGEAIDTIENNIDYTASSVEQGTSELQKAAQHQSRYRKKLFYLALIGTIILVILIIVLIVELKR